MRFLVIFSTVTTCYVMGLALLVSIEHTILGGSKPVQIALLLFFGMYLAPKIGKKVDEYMKRTDKY